MRYAWSIIVLLVLAGLVFFWLIKTPVLASYLSSKLKVPVSIGKISVWPSETTMRNFHIKNPHGFKTHTAFEAEKTKVQYQWHNLLKEPATIDLIEIDNVFLSVEFSNPLGTQNNWTAIASKMEKKEGKGKQVLIHKLVITNLSVQIRGLGLTPTQTKTIPYLEFNEINSEHGFPTKELIKAIFGGAGLQQYIQELPQKIIQKVLPFGANEKGALEEPLVAMD